MKMKQVKKKRSFSLLGIAMIMAVLTLSVTSFMLASAPATLFTSTKYITKEMYGAADFYVVKQGTMITTTSEATLTKGWWGISVAGEDGENKSGAALGGAGGWVTGMFEITENDITNYSGKVSVLAYGGGDSPNTGSNGSGRGGDATIVYKGTGLTGTNIGSYDSRVIAVAAGGAGGGDQTDSNNSGIGGKGGVISNGNKTVSAGTYPNPGKLSSSNTGGYPSGGKGDRDSFWGDDAGGGGGGWPGGAGGGSDDGGEGGTSVLRGKAIPDASGSFAQQATLLEQNYTWNGRNTGAPPAVQFIYLGEIDPTTGRTNSW